MPSEKLLIQVAKTKSGKLTDQGSQLLTNSLHDYHPPKIMKNRRRLLVVVEMGRRVVVEQENQSRSKVAPKVKFPAGLGEKNG